MSEDPKPAPPPAPAPAAPLPPTTGDLERRIAAHEKRWEDQEGLTKKEREEIRVEIGRLSKLLEAAPKEPKAPKKEENEWDW